MQESKFPAVTKNVYPNGATIQYGGTRQGVQTYYLDRYEQTPIVMARGDKPCVLHHSSQNFVEGWSNNPNFRLIKGTSVVHPGHYIWLPTECPQSEEDIRSWGGSEMTKGIFDLTLRLIRDNWQVPEILDT